MENRNLRWGILSTAEIATKTVAGFHDATNDEVVAVASRSLEKAGAWPTAHGVPRAYGTYDELLADDTIDAVYIPLPRALRNEHGSRRRRSVSRETEAHMTDEMKHWEYRVQTIGSMFGTKDELIQTTLDDWGLEGWEAINVFTPENSGKITIVAKRPLTERARRMRSMPSQ